MLSSAPSLRALRPRVRRLSSIGLRQATSIAAVRAEHYQFERRLPPTRVLSTGQPERRLPPIMTDYSAEYHRPQRRLPPSITDHSAAWAPPSHRPAGCLHHTDRARPGGGRLRTQTYAGVQSGVSVAGASGRERGATSLAVGDEGTLSEVVEGGSG